MKTHDAVGRAYRYSKTKSTSKYVKDQYVFNDKDALVLCALQTHSKLPSNYLRLLIGDKSQNAFSKRMKRAFRDQWKYVKVSDRQKDGAMRRAQYLTYELTKKGYEKLREIERYEQHTQKLTNWASHQLYTAIFTASVELWCREKGFTFISHQQIFNDPRSTHKRIELPTTTGAVIPDQLFGIRYGDKVRFFVLELDRATEDSDTVLEKFKKYDEVFTQRLFRAWGINNLSVLFYTTSERRARNFIEHTYRNWFLFQWNEILRDFWIIPEQPLPFMDQPWLTCEGEYYINRP